MNLRLRLLILTATAVSACIAQTTARGDDGALTGKSGKDLFLKYTCYGCHGFSGQNGTGARLVPMKMTQAGFVAYVRNPPRANAMPSYSPKALPDSELITIYNYIKSLPDSEPKAKDVAVLSGILSEVSNSK
jgi:mono/diheme cytochrome c family protein